MEESTDIWDLMFKTGMRVPVEGRYVDQYGVVTHHLAHKTFPPCVGRKDECAWRQLVRIGR